MSEPAWIWGYAAKSPDGDLDYITAETAEDVKWSLGSGMLEKGWTAVPVEIRERDIAPIDAEICPLFEETGT